MRVIFLHHISPAQVVNGDARMVSPDSPSSSKSKNVQKEKASPKKVNKVRQGKTLLNLVVIGKYMAFYNVLNQRFYRRNQPCTFPTYFSGHVDAGKSTLMGHLLYLLGDVSKKTMHKYPLNKTSKHTFLSNTCLAGTCKITFKIFGGFSLTCA